MAVGRTVEVGDLVGTAEIADRLSRYRYMAHAWLRLHPAFPRPVARLTIGHVWSWAGIEAWAVATGRYAAGEPPPAVLAAGRFVDAADLVSSSDIAVRLGRSRETVNRWRRQRSFPEPVVILEIGPFEAGPTSKPGGARQSRMPLDVNYGCGCERAVRRKA